MLGHDECFTGATPQSRYILYCLCIHGVPCQHILKFEDSLVKGDNLGDDGAAIPQPPKPQANMKKKMAKPPKVIVLVDTGLVSMVMMTVLIDGNPYMVKTANENKTKMKPLTFEYTGRRYYTEIGEVKTRCIRQHRLAEKPHLKKYFEALSGSSLNTGDVVAAKAALRQRRKPISNAT